jgi:hypothetical protein
MCSERSPGPGKSLVGLPACDVETVRQNTKERLRRVEGQRTQQGSHQERWQLHGRALAPYEDSDPSPALFSFIPRLAEPRT